MQNSLLPAWFHWDCLTFSGANIKVFAHCSALVELEKQMGNIPVHSWLRGTCGCSSGSVLALFLACRMPPSEILDWMLQVDYVNVRKEMKSGNILQMILKLRSKFGVMNPQPLRKLLSLQVEKLVGLKDPTFAEIFAITGIEFVTVATSLCSGGTVYYSTTLTPDEKVLSACIASMSLPAIFESVRTIDGDYLVDGGVTDFLPMEYYRGRTLGFMIVGDTSSVSLNAGSVSDSVSVSCNASTSVGDGDDSRHRFQPPGSFVQHIDRIKDIMCDINNWRQAVSRFGIENIIVIQSSSFDIRKDVLTESDKQQMVQSGISAANLFVANCKARQM